MKLSYEELRESAKHHMIGLHRKINPIETVVRETLKSVKPTFYRVKPYTVDMVVTPYQQKWVKCALSQVHSDLTALSSFIYFNVIDGIDSFLDRYQETIEEFGNGPIDVEYPREWTETFNELTEEEEELDYHSRVKDVINHDEDDWYVANIKAFEDEESEAEYTIWFDFEQLYSTEDDKSEHRVESTTMIRDTYEVDSLEEVSQIVQRMMNENDKETIQQKLAKADEEGII
ncbi:hypothetical protein JMJ58_03815 [Haloterrigena salifodinae]|uniref:Uncharacterized protein n=1 Tax=Haloterrigena salifodinae TaxID=2675099 RepID=A0A8T8E3D9_9EURY|nr:hypothetical protein [Haloterrigena salifodinae]QRV16036.1 hypothetical protein JMJ58_03815 [Haloterrigena salifodinae]